MFKFYFRLNISFHSFSIFTYLFLITFFSQRNFGLNLLIYIDLEGTQALIFLFFFKYMDNWSNYFCIETLDENKNILIVKTSPKRYFLFALVLNNENKNILAKVGIFWFRNATAVPHSRIPLQQFLLRVYLSFQTVFAVMSQFLA